MNFELRANTKKMLNERDLFVKSISYDLDSLNVYGIDYFMYRAFTKTGESFSFSTQDQWYCLKKTEDFCEAMRVHFENEITHLYCNKLKYVTRSGESVKNEYLRQLALNGMGNGVGIYKFKKERIESFFFYSISENAYARDIIINHLNSLENSTQFLSKKINHLMASNKQYVLSNTLPLKFHNSEVLFQEQKLSKHFKTKNVELLINGQQVFFTLRELELLTVLKYSYSNKEVSNRLGISVRTVEGFIEKIRSKCRLNSKCELIHLLQKPELQIVLRQTQRFSSYI